MDIVSWIKTTLSKYSSNSTHDKNAIYFVKNEDGKTGKIISDEIVYGNGGGANGVVVESSNQPAGGESVWVNPDEDPEEVAVYNRSQVDALHQSIVNSITSLSEAGYLFSGVATSKTDPGTPDTKVFYIANGKGTYEKFGGINVTEDDVVILYWDASWHKMSTGIASDQKLSELTFTVEGERYINMPVSYSGEHKSTTDIVKVNIKAGTYTIGITSEQEYTYSVHIYVKYVNESPFYIVALDMGTEKLVTFEKDVEEISFYSQDAKKGNIVVTLYSGTGLKQKIETIEDIIESNALCDTQEASKFIKEVYSLDSISYHKIVLYRASRNFNGEWDIVIRLFSDETTYSQVAATLYKESSFVELGTFSLIVDWNAITIGTRKIFQSEIWQKGINNIDLSPSVNVNLYKKNQYRQFCNTYPSSKMLKELYLPFFDGFDSVWVSQVRKESTEYAIIFNGTKGENTKTLYLTSHESSLLISSDQKNYAIVDWSVLENGRYYSDSALKDNYIEVDMAINKWLSPTIYSYLQGNDLSTKYLNLNNDIKGMSSSVEGITQEIATINNQLTNKLESETPNSISLNMLKEDVRNLLGGGEGGSSYLPNSDDLYIDDNSLLSFSNKTRVVGQNGQDIVFVRGNQFNASTISKANTIYIIRQSMIISGDFTMPENCVLLFLGGSLGGGKLIGNGTAIHALNCQIFYNVELDGYFCVNGWNVCWFGVVADMKTDNTEALQYAVNAFANMYGNRGDTGYATGQQGLYFPSGRYYIGNTVNLPAKVSMHGRGTTSVIYTDYSGTLFEFTSGGKSIHLYDMVFEFHKDNPCGESVCFKSTNGHIADSIISRCKFYRFNIQLDLYVSYWLRINSCDFTGASSYALKLHNPNDISVTNCNFRGNDDDPRKSAIYMYGGAAGVNITGNDFSGGTEAAIVCDGSFGGMVISGNYFEGIYKMNNYECWIMPFIQLGSSGSIISDVIIQGNCAYEDNSGTANASPRYWVKLACSKLINSKIDAELSIPLNISGYGNSGNVSFHKDEVLNTKFEEGLVLGRELLSMSPSESNYASKLQEKKDVDTAIKNILSDSSDEEAIERAKAIFSMYINRKDGKIYLKQ